MQTPHHKESPVSDLTRRGFVKSSTAAAAGATVIGALAAERAEAAGSEPLVAYVSDPKSGEISVMSGDREATVRDRDLAARIARAAR
jgi:anti-sigma-K factor RskA